MKRLEFSTAAFGEVPDWEALASQFPNLEVLRSTDSSLVLSESPFPSDALKSMARLKEIVLPSMNLNGNLPSDFLDSFRLEVLDISSNRLSGSIPTSGLI